MDVSYDPETFRITQIPESREAWCSNVNVADQALGVEVVKVGDLYHDRYSLSGSAKQEDARFPSATKTPTTELLNRLLPQVEPNL